jgi:rhodanese-related sulfurtransferase
VLGGLVGVFAFGETVDLYKFFWNGSYFGRLTLMDVFNLPAGILVILITLMAIFMLWGGEQLEKIYGGKDPRKAPRARYYGAGVLVLLAVVVAVIGQPTTADRWARLEPQRRSALVNREVYIDPGELLDTMHDHKINLIMIDVRNEADYNLFHLLDAENISPDNIPKSIDEFIAQPANTVFVVMSNGETLATETWKTMTAQAVPNVYILSGGINNWLDTFFTQYEEDFCGEKRMADEEELQYEFNAALGSNCPAAYPDQDKYDLKYEKKIQLELKRAPAAGGCG